MSSHTFLFPFGNKRERMWDVSLRQTAPPPFSNSPRVRFDQREKTYLNENWSEKVKVLFQNIQHYLQSSTTDGFAVTSRACAPACSTVLPCCPADSDNSGKTPLSSHAWLYLARQWQRCRNRRHDPICHIAAEFDPREHVFLFNPHCGANKEDSSVAVLK